MYGANGAFLHLAIAAAEVAPARTQALAAWLGQKSQDLQENSPNGQTACMAGTDQRHCTAGTSSRNYRLRNGGVRVLLIRFIYKSAYCRA